jgi:hypothetical protein
LPFRSGLGRVATDAFDAFQNHGTKNVPNIQML